LASNQLRTSSEPASVMEFGFNASKMRNQLTLAGVPQNSLTDLNP